MNKLFSLSVIPLAATATIASVMMASAPAQALNMGQVAVSGNADFLTPSQITFNNVFVETDASDATGIFAGLQGSSVAVSNLFFTGMGNAYNGVNTFLSFTNGVTFDLDAGMADLYQPNLNAVDLDFSGTFFTGSGQSLGKGNFAVLTSGSGATSFNLTAEAVPEPLTLLGTGIALGFGGLFKNKSGKKQAVNA